MTDDLKQAVAFPLKVLQRWVSSAIAHATALKSLTEASQTLPAAHPAAALTRAVVPSLLSTIHSPKRLPHFTRPAAAKSSIDGDCGLVSVVRKGKSTSIRVEDTDSESLRRAASRSRVRNGSNSRLMR